MLFVFVVSLCKFILCSLPFVVCLVLFYHVLFIWSCLSCAVCLGLFVWSCLSCVVCFVPFVMYCLSCVAYLLFSWSVLHRFYWRFSI